MSRNCRTVSFGLVIALVLGSNFVSAEELANSLTRYVDARIAEFERIPGDRQKQLQEFSEMIGATLRKGNSVQVTFICTHNSRRSHLSQIWAATAAKVFDVAPVHTFSGGTEATAFNPRAVEALRRAGFEIDVPTPSPNPRYLVRSVKGLKLECFSKVYDEASNPMSDYFAVMTCSQADRDCPVVKGATSRIAIPYDDPKAFDGTPAEASKYDERCQQIAREMLFLFSKI